jgi:NitT/TauT family transport system substrate-binding protein
MSFGPFRRAAAVAAVAALALSGCSDSNNSDSVKGLEKTQIKIGVLPILDDAPVYVGIDKGYFKAEGLDVKLVPIAGGAVALPQLVQGGLDVVFSNYVSVYKAQAKGVAKFRVLAEGYQAKQHVMAVVAVPGKLTTPKQLDGKTIAVNNRDNIGELTISSALRASDVDTSKIQYKEIPFPEMAAALQRGDVDAAWLVEPFITNAEKNLGAHIVVDTGTGPTADFPMAGYIATAQFAQRDPNTVAAFRRALAKAQAAASDRQNLQRVLPKYTKLDAQTAAITAIGTFPATPDPSPVRLQRVADLMQQFNMLSARLDVKTLTE